MLKKENTNFLSIYFSYFIEQKTLSGLSVEPDTPDFTWESLPSENGYANIKVNWMPNLRGKPGSHFFAKYRIKGETTWLQSDNILEDDYVIVRGLEPDQNYEFVVASVDGEFLKESYAKEVSTSGIG